MLYKICLTIAEALNQYWHMFSWLFLLQLYSARPCSYHSYLTHHSASTQSSQTGWSITITVSNFLNVIGFWSSRDIWKEAVYHAYWKERRITINSWSIQVPDIISKAYASVIGALHSVFKKCWIFLNGGLFWGVGEKGSKVMMWENVRSWWIGLWTGEAHISRWIQSHTKHYLIHWDNE